MTDELKKFLKRSKLYFNFSAIERATGIAEGGISKALNNVPSRSLTPEQEAAVRKYFATTLKELSKIIAQ